MKQNNTGRKLKAIIALVLVTVSLFVMSSVVSAEFIEIVFGEEGISLLALTSSSPEEEHECEWTIVCEGDYCKACGKSTARQYEVCSICEATRNDTGWDSCDCPTTTRSN